MSDNVTDIVARLREMAPSRPPDLIWGERSTRDLSNDIREAADTIEALLKQLENARDDALEEAANVADDHAFNAWHIADAEGQNSACASGRNYGGRAIAKYIRALKGKP